MGPGSTWGQQGTPLWLRGNVTVPPAWRESPCALLLELTSSPAIPVKALLYVNGRATQGFDARHPEVLLTPEQKAAGTLSLTIQAWSDPPQPALHVIARLDLARLDADLEDLYYSLYTAWDVARNLPANSLLRYRLEELLGKAQARFTRQKPGSTEFYRQVTEVKEWFQHSLAALGEDFGPDSRPVVTSIGYSSLRSLEPEARRRVHSTGATSLHLMQHYPEYRFLQNQPSWYRWLQEEDPALYTRLQTCVSAGTWEATGGVWSLADSRMPSGESLVRQLLYGTRFFREQLGCECQLLFLPQTPGCSGNLPQLIRKSGLRYFLTAHLSGCPRPADTFLWRGIDGTEVLTYCLPYLGKDAEEANRPAEGPSMIGLGQEAWEQYRQKACHDEVLLLWEEDGGFTRQELEYIRHLQQVPGPLDFQMDTVENFFSRLAARVSSSLLPLWTGEIPGGDAYPGVPGPLQKAPRECEVLYHNAELFGVMAAQYGGVVYPQAALRRGWELLLESQGFHSPGPDKDPPSGTTQEIRRDRIGPFREIQRIGTEALDEALAGLAAQVNLNQESLVVFNPCSWARTDTVAVPWEGDGTELSLRDLTGNEVRFQTVETESGTEIVFTAEEVPPLGYRAYALAESSTAEPSPLVKGDYGPLTMLLNDPQVTHIQVQSPFQIFAERGGKLQVVAERFQDEAQVRAVAERLAQMLGEVLNEAHPGFDQLWPDGTRIRVQIPPLSLRGTLITIWKREENPLVELERRHAALARSSVPRSRRNPFKANPRRLENDFFRLTLNDYGQVIDLLDKRQDRNIFSPETPGNVFQAIGGGARSLPIPDETIPAYLEPLGEVITRLVGAEVPETGPERGVVELAWRYRDSQIQQRITMYRAVPRIDFVTDLDWREPQTRLQVSFPVDIHAFQAQHEIQFGNLLRPTHRNRGGEGEIGAGYERWAQKWVDLSEGDYGVSLLNDGRYEHDLRDNVLRLTLFPAGSPGEEEVELADPRWRRFTYSLYPHPGDWARGGTTQQAYQLNYPFLVRREPAHSGALPASHSFLSGDADHVIIETVKWAEEEEEECWVVRVYDYANRRGPVTLTCGQPIARAAECNLVEREDQPLKPRGRTLEFEIRPYEIKTFKVWLA